MFYTNFIGTAVDKVMSKEYLKLSFVESVIGNEVYFGEILGKHSEVYGTLEEGRFNYTF